MYGCCGFNIIFFFMYIFYYICGKIHFILFALQTLFNRAFQLNNDDDDDDDKKNIAISNEEFIQTNKIP